MVEGVQRGVIVAGHEVCDPAVDEAATRLGWPVLGRLRWPRLLEALGPLPHVRFGRPPSPRYVERWLARSPAAGASPCAADPAWQEWWQRADEVAWAAVEATLAGTWGAPAVAYNVARSLSDSAALHVANSLSLRDNFDYGDGRAVHANLGVNGIDGTLSTALGEGWARPDRPVCLMVGDLAFLHDQGALLAAADVPGRVTAVVVDDRGGGIFRTPDLCGQTDPAVWERLFVTPHATDIVALCSAHGVPARRVRSAAGLVAGIQDDLERPGLGVVVADVVGCDDVGLRARAQTAANGAIARLGAMP